MSRRMFNRTSDNNIFPANSSPSPFDEYLKPQQPQPRSRQTWANQHRSQLDFGGGPGGTRSSGSMMAPELPQSHSRSRPQQPPAAGRHSSSMSNAVNNRWSMEGYDELRANKERSRGQMGLLMGNPGAKFEGSTQYASVYGRNGRGGGQVMSPSSVPLMANSPSIGRSYGDTRYDPQLSPYLSNPVREEPLKIPDDVAKLNLRDTGSNSSMTPRRSGDMTPNSQQNQSSRSRPTGLTPSAARINANAQISVPSHIIRGGPTSPSHYPGPNYGPDQGQMRESSRSRPRAEQRHLMTTSEPYGSDITASIEEREKILRNISERSPRERSSVNQRGDANPINSEIQEREEILRNILEKRPEASSSPSPRFDGLKMQLPYVSQANPTRYPIFPEEINNNRTPTRKIMFLGTELEDAKEDRVSSYQAAFRGSSDGAESSRTSTRSRPTGRSSDQYNNNDFESSRGFGSPGPSSPSRGVSDEMTWEANKRRARGSALASDLGQHPLAKMERASNYASDFGESSDSSAMGDNNYGIPSLSHPDVKLSISDVDKELKLLGIH